MNRGIAGLRSPVGHRPPSVGGAPTPQCCRRRPPVNAFVAALGFLAIAWAVLVVLVGRHLIFNDVVRRRSPRRGPLDRIDVETVSFRSHDGLRLEGWFVPATGTATGWTAVLLHGWHRSRERVARHARLLAERGIGVLAYDQRGHGASETGMITFGEREAKDLACALRYLGTRSDVDPARIAAVGLSLGSGGVLYHLASGNEPPVQRAVLEGVYGVSSDVGLHLLQRRFGRLLGYVVGLGVFTVGAAVCSLGRFRHSRPVDRLTRVAVPLLLIRGRQDDLVPEDSAEAVIAAAPPGSVVWRTEASGHTRALDAYPEEYAERVVGFITGEPDETGRRSNRREIGR